MEACSVRFLRAHWTYSLFGRSTPILQVRNFICTGCVTLSCFQVKEIKIWISERGPKEIKSITESSWYKLFFKQRSSASIFFGRLHCTVCILNFSQMAIGFA